MYIQIIYSLLWDDEMRNYAQAGDSPPQSATQVESRVTEFNRSSVKLQKQKIEIHKRKDIGRTVERK